VADLGRRDFVVIGGGLVGSAIAWGLGRAGATPLVLDEDDRALRASRANNALVWVQGKGLGLPDYALWTRSSAERWPQLAGLLVGETGIDVGLRQSGGFEFCLSQPELDQQRGELVAIARAASDRSAPFQVLDREETRARLPGVGPALAGSIFCPSDGHVNALRLFHALHAGMAARRCEYRACHPVQSIAPEAGGFRIRGAWGQVRAERLILAAGLGNERLAPMVGSCSPLKHSKGQILVTEKCAPLFPYSSTLFTQSSDGGILIGASQEADNTSPLTSQQISAVMARRAVMVFPALAALNVVRTWTGFRVKPRDGFPIYDQPQAAPGAFVITSHSSVTLAANHALVLVPQILAGRLDAELRPFAAGRLHVPQNP